MSPPESVRSKILSNGDLCPQKVDSRPEVQNFSPYETLYRRVHPKCLSCGLPGKGAFAFDYVDRAGHPVPPNMSINRKKFCDPGCNICNILCFQEQRDWMVVEFSVEDLKIPQGSTSHNGYVAYPRHEIVRVKKTNYAHSEVRIYDNHGEIKPGTDISKPGTDIFSFWNHLAAQLVHAAQRSDVSFDCRDPRTLIPDCHESRPAIQESTIRGVAYHLWERRGRPRGSPEVDWFEAERLLKIGR